IGATTENPFFEVNAALVSRSRIFQLKSLTETDLKAIAIQALADKDRGYGDFRVSFDEGALEHIIDVANGDARSLLNALQLAVETSVEHFPPPEKTEIHITSDAAEQSIQRKAVLYDKEGDYHFDVISAFIKSLRGSDPDAALYWLARMVSAGEDPKFIFRRLLISACEDVGLADPNAIVVVEADAQAFERIGFPEGRFHLTHAALYLATAPKSNSTMAFFDALKGVEEEAQDEVPNHLRDGNRDAKGFGHGQGYLYPHAFQDHWVAQQYLPTSLQGKVYYQPSDQGYEKNIRSEVNRRREEQLESIEADAFVENLTYSPGDKERERWLSRTTSERGSMLQGIRTTLFAPLSLRRSDRALICNAGHGLLLWEAYRQTPEGLVVAQVQTSQQLQHISHYADSLQSLEKPTIMHAPLEKVLASLEEGLVFEAILGRNTLTRLSEKEALLNLLKERLAPQGILHLAEGVPSEGSRLSDFCSASLQELLRKAETLIYGGDGNTLSNWKSEDLLSSFVKKGFTTKLEQQDLFENRFITKTDISRWLGGSYLSAWESLNIEVDLPKVEEELISLLGGRSIRWKHHLCFVLAMHQDSKA
ncbi:MAG TPA: AAA family ATPase, partial [Sphaerochaeta sp.]|nr:AAA family ATPase [Sphaerochaeta sp.]